jgi:hypothetical protein
VKTLELVHVVHCSPADYCRAFVDIAYNEALYLEVLGFRSWRQTMTGVYVRRVEAEPPMSSLPAWLQKEGRYVEIGETRDGAADGEPARYLFVTENPHVVTRGSIEVSRCDGGTLRRARVSIQPSLLASFALELFVSELVAGYEASARFTPLWLDRQKAQAALARPVGASRVRR